MRTGSVGPGGAGGAGGLTGGGARKYHPAVPSEPGGHDLRSRRVRPAQLADTTRTADRRTETSSRPHRMPPTRRTLVLIRRGDHEVTRIRVSRRRLATLGAGLGFAVGCVALAGWFAAASRSGRVEIERLRAENETLRLASSSFEDRLQSLRERIAETEDRTRKLTIVAGMADPGSSGEAGVGGTLHSATSDAALDALATRNEQLAATLDQVANRLDQNLRRLSATPSTWPVAGILTSGFGNRRDPLTGQAALHSGIDISAPPGRPVAATASGVVVKTEQYGGLGRAVFISHGFGRTTVYGHMSRLLVSPGQKVERGTPIGLVGNTGRSTGYHLHYEVRVDGKAVNPLPYLLTGPRTGS